MVTDCTIYLVICYAITYFDTSFKQVYIRCFLFYMLPDDGYQRLLLRELQKNRLPRAIAFKQ